MWWVMTVGAHCGSVLAGPVSAGVVTSVLAEVANMRVLRLLARHCLKVPADRQDSTAGWMVRKLLIAELDGSSFDVVSTLRPSSGHAKVRENRLPSYSAERE